MNFILNLARIPLDEQNPERKKEPDNQEDAQEDNYGDGNPKRKFTQDLFNELSHSYLCLLLSALPRTHRMTNQQDFRYKTFGYFGLFSFSYLFR
jgi:hypothetical protein